MQILKLSNRLSSSLLLEKFIWRLAMIFHGHFVIVSRGTNQPVFIENHSQMLQDLTNLFNHFEQCCLIKENKCKNFHRKRNFAKFLWLWMTFNQFSLTILYSQQQQMPSYQVFFQENMLENIFWHEWLVMFMTSCFWPQHVNSLWPRDAIWWHRSGSTVAQVMSCCLNQCWLIINEIFWHSLKAFYRKYTRYLSLIWVWKLLIQDYIHISQGPMSLKIGDYHIFQRPIS